LQHRPQAAALLEVTSPQPYPYRLVKVPEGRWFIHAVATADSADPEPWTCRSPLVGGCGPVRVAAGSGTIAAISLRPRSRADLPVLLALPDLEAPPGGRACPRSLSGAGGYPGDERGSSFPAPLGGAR